MVDVRSTSASVWGLRRRRGSLWRSLDRDHSIRCQGPLVLRCVRDSVGSEGGFRAGAEQSHGLDRMVMIAQCSC